MTEQSYPLASKDNGPEVVKYGDSTPEVYHSYSSQTPAPSTPEKGWYSDKQTSPVAQPVYEESAIATRLYGWRRAACLWFVVIFAFSVGIGAGSGIIWGATASARNCTVPTSTPAAVPTGGASAYVPTSTITNQPLPTPDASCYAQQPDYRSNLTSLTYKRLCDQDKDLNDFAAILANFITWSWDECIGICDAYNAFTNSTSKMSLALYIYSGKGQSVNVPMGSCFCLSAGANTRLLPWTGIHLARLN